MQRRLEKVWWAIFLVLVVEGARVEWRVPASGFWFDPQNWRDMDTGEIRTPGIDDDVVIHVNGYGSSGDIATNREGVFWSGLMEQANYTVNVVQVEGEAPIKIRSLAVGGDWCGKCPEYSEIKFDNEAVVSDVIVIIKRCGFFRLQLIGAQIETIGNINAHPNSNIILGENWQGKKSTLKSLSGSISFFGDSRTMLAGTGLISAPIGEIELSEMELLIIKLSYDFALENVDPEPTTNLTGNTLQLSAANINFREAKMNVLGSLRETDPAKLDILDGNIVGDVEVLLAFNASGEAPPAVRLNIITSETSLDDLDVKFRNGSTDVERYDALSNLNFLLESKSGGSYISDLDTGYQDCHVSQPQVTVCQQCVVSTTPCSASPSGKADISVLLSPSSGDQTCDAFGDCPLGCSGTRGTCQPGKICACDGIAPGGRYFGFGCEAFACENDCNNRGVCTDPRDGDILTTALPFCKCDAGWDSTDDCSVPLCPNNCTSPDHGECNPFVPGPPVCICKPGWVSGVDGDCSVAARCPGPIENQCNGNGACDLTTGKCICNSTWAGPDCSLADCPSGCNHHGSCVFNSDTQIHKCECDEGWSGFSCRKANCPADCSDHGQCVEQLDPPRCVCDVGYHGLNCSQYYLNNSAGTEAFGTPFGDIIADYQAATTALSAQYFCGGFLDRECSGHGSCNSNTLECECRIGFLEGEFGWCEKAWCEETDDICGEHGFCRTDLAEPACQCEAFFFGPTCNKTNSPCPGFPSECSDRGTCIDGNCVCDYEASGLDCSVGNCSRDRFGNLCSNHGECTLAINSTEFEWNCECEAGWDGTVCEVALCPVDDDGNVCSGHGECLLQGDEHACICNRGFEGDICEDDSKSGNDDEDLIWVWVVISVVIITIIVVIVIITLIAIVIVVRKKLATGKEPGSTVSF